MDYKLAFLKAIEILPKEVEHTSMLRVDRLMHAVLSPAFLQQTPKIVITGTNGKGSTAIMVDSIMRQNGIKTGLFTSPHFLEFSERFRIAGEMPDYKQLYQLSKHILELAAQIEADLHQRFCFFDILFVMALAIFERNDAELLIFEAGIGGRYDPVRLLKSPLTALTSVSKEHTNILGDTEELIAFDKLDACYPGGTTVLGRLPLELIDKLKTYSELRNVHLIESVSQVQVEGTTMKISGYDDIEFNPQVLGLVQQTNMQTAIALCMHYYGEELPEDFARQCKLGLELCTVPGRFEKIADNPPIYIDAAHTNDAFEMLFDTIAKDFGDKPIIMLAGISQQRDNVILAQQLGAVADEIIITQPHFRGEDPEKLFVQCRTSKTKFLEQDVQSAIILAKQRADACGGRIFVVGSLFLAGEVTALEKGMPLEQLYLH